MRDSNNKGEFKMGNKYLTRKEAAIYLTSTLGLPTSHKTLAKLATTGGGPEYQHFGRRRVVYTLESLVLWADAPRKQRSNEVVYTLESLVLWANSKLSKPILNSSQQL